MQDIDKKDILGRTYEYCLSMFAETEGKKAGEFYTPACVVKTLVSVLKPFDGRVYDPCCGSGGMFRRWIYSDAAEPYGSYGNGAAMRVSPCGFVGQTIEEVKMLARKVTEVPHNHPEGLKGAEVTAVAIFLAKTGHTIPEIRAYIDENYYPMNFTLDEIRPTYAFDVTCQGSVPQVIMAFLESTSFEDAIRNAISIGGDSDTIGAITGGIAEAYYGVPEKMREKAMEYLDERLREVLVEFEGKYGASQKRVE